MTLPRACRWGTIAVLLVACSDDESREQRICEDLVVGSEQHDAGQQLAVDGVDAGALSLVVATAFDVALVVEKDRRELEDACRRLKTVAPMPGPCRLTVEDVVAPSVVADIATGALDGRPQCRRSFSDEAACLATCTISNGCDTTASCKGGTLDIDCDGVCTPLAPEPLRCDARCEGQCSGVCIGTSTCDGFCDGECATRSADGACVGECRGRCRMRTGVAASCDGACVGTCTTTCRPEGERRRCNGTCDGPVRSVSCAGAVELSGCVLDEPCAAACRARAFARAECTVPIVVRTSGAPLVLPTDLRRLIDAALLVRARGMTFVESLATYTQHADVLLGPLASRDSNAGYCSGELMWIVDQAALVARTNAERAEEFLGTIGIRE